MKLLNRKIVSFIKKTYEIPSVEMTQLMPSTVVLAGSPGTLKGSGEGTESLGGGEIIGG